MLAWLKAAAPGLPTSLNSTAPWRTCCSPIVSRTSYGRDRPVARRVGSQGHRIQGRLRCEIRYADLLSRLPNLPADDVFAGGTPKWAGSIRERTRLLWVALTCNRYALHASESG